MSKQSGTLYVVATPIGNREDITARAIKVLQSVDGILAEDTRHSKPLLTSLGIHNHLIAFHAHNEATKTKILLEKLITGHSYALISDAGTPLISDPGFPLVKAARELAIPVTPIPGPCALIAALSAAGVPCDIFTFAGFLPAKSAARRQELTRFTAMMHTLVFYESSHRIIECIQDIQHVFGEACSLVLVKELTKTFERFVEGTGNDVLQWLLSDTVHTNGEFVLIIPPRKITEDDTAAKKVLSILLKELSLKQAVKMASQLVDVPKNKLYQLALDSSHI